ncbi:MAG: PKD domain-containing protein [Geothermobacteraceae bacterium]
MQDYVYADAAEFKAKVDLSAWDYSTACSSCHVGGSGVEHDRNGVRLSQRVLTDAANGVLTAWTSYVEEQYDPLTGMPNHVVKTAPWSYPYDVPMPDGSTTTIQMPNVKEMDCLYCHLDGYQNLNYSVMTYMGAHNAAPMAGAGLMDMNQASPTYQGYNSAMVDVDASGFVSLNNVTLSRIQGNPSEQNCRQCHAPSGLKDIPDMMRDFLSSAPMVYTGSPQSFTGLEMPAFDFNAPFGMSWDFSLGPYASSPVITLVDMMTQPWAYIPSIGYPAAMGQTAFNSLAPGDIGGGNPAGTGPLYFQAPLDPQQPMGYQDQNALKKGTVPFPRAEWFKRGDLFNTRQDEVHSQLGCAGCHMDTDTLLVDGVDASIVDPSKAGLKLDGKSLCDPGRGYDSASGIEKGTANDDGEFVYSRNTVKKCADCHITGKNSDGVSIQTFGAPDPTVAHQQAGVTALLTNAVGVDASGAEVNFKGSHLDVVDCTVCHVYKKQMVVRSLDSTSGNRYPTMLGFDFSKGMLGMFTEPMPGQTNDLQEWWPLYTWMKIGDGPKKLGNGLGNPNWRRKVYPVNSIVAALWNNVDPNVDANGDGVAGRPFGADGNLTNYDPWIQRDLKAGMNFGPSGFAPIPVGFGGPSDGVTGGAYMSAYAPDGTFTGAWNYVGVYGGNVIFSTPEEIEAYKTYRSAIAPAIDGKSWDKTELLYLGGPYMVTHNVRDTDQFVLGAPTRDQDGNILSYGCSDCHAPDKPFFVGGFNMTGSAIKATAGQSFMQSPAEIMQVVAKEHDLNTGAELATKTGTPVEVRFEELGCWDSATRTFWALGDDMGSGDLCDTNDANYGYKRVTDLDRAEALYPAGPFVDVDGNTYANLASWTAYLTSIDAASAGIGTDPVAAISAPAGNEVEVGTAVTFSADTSLNTKGSFTYTWDFNDGSDDAVGDSVTHTFSTVGSYLVALRVTDEEGKSDVVVKTITVKAPAPPADINLSGSATVGSAADVVFANLGTFTRLIIYWGDGSRSIDNTGGTDTITIQHTYGTAGDKLVKVLVYNGRSRTGIKSGTITIGP